MIDHGNNLNLAVKNNNPASYNAIVRSVNVFQNNEAKKLDEKLLKTETNDFVRFNRSIQQMNDSIIYIESQIRKLEVTIQYKP